MRCTCTGPTITDILYVTQPRIIHIESLDALRATAGAWDDLWRRGAATLPSLRAELLAQWVEQFSRPEDFSAIAVESEGRLAAALPLIRSRKKGSDPFCRNGPKGASHKRGLYPFVRAAAMPCNEWVDSGDLLLDADDAADEALRALATGIRETDVPLLWLDAVTLDAARWRRFQQALLRGGMTVAGHRRWLVGRVEIDHDWPAYKARWSRKHRQKMAQAARRRGDVRLDVRSRLAPHEVETAMRQCFEIEDRGWKGAAGTSVLRTPGMAGFFVRQAEQAARCGQLEIVTLHCGGRPAAFSYGLSAKGVFHSIKTSYDPEYAEYQPGQLLRYYLLERFFADPERKAMDFLGPMTEAHAAWQPERYAVGRVAVAPRGLAGRLAVLAYKHVWPLVRRGTRRGVD